jgi:hypothetical protein
MAERWWAIGLAVTVPIETLEAATLMALKRMDIEVKGREPIEGGRKITAHGCQGDIDIELDRLTRQTARIRVDANEKLTLEDRATAADIITQTVRVIDDQTRSARATQPAAQLTAAPRAPVPRLVVRIEPISSAPRTR